MIILRCLQRRVRLKSCVDPKSTRVHLKNINTENNHVMSAKVAETSMS